MSLSAPFELQSRSNPYSAVSPGWSSSSSSFNLSSDTDMSDAPWEDDLDRAEEAAAAAAQTAAAGGFQHPQAAAAKAPTGKRFSISDSRREGGKTTPRSSLGNESRVGGGAHATPKSSPRNAIGRDYGQASVLGSTIDASPVFASPSFDSRDDALVAAEQALWDERISDAVDKADGNLDLTRSSLTFIPRNISDLSSLVVLSQPSQPSQHSAVQLSYANKGFSRYSSAPATYRGSTPLGAGNLHGRGSAKPVSTSPGFSLFLGGNILRTLPRELFSLRNLTVLSLRQNKLDYIPPSIASLTSLVELNIAGNRIQYLPAEIQQLHITTLSLNANSFILPPPHLKSSAPLVLAPTSELPKMFGEIKRTWPTAGRVLPLSEMAYRVLLATVSTPASSYLGRKLLNWELLYDVEAWCEVTSDSKQVFDVLKAATPNYTPRDHDDPTLKAHIIPSASSSSLVTRTTANNLTGSALNVSKEAAAHYPHHCPSPRHSKAPNTPVNDRAFLRSLTGISKVALPRSTSTSTSPFSSTSLGTPPSIPPITEQPTYLMHAEERMEWTNVIAGFTLPAGELVPILWRGCSFGCLAFLEGPPKHNFDEDDNIIEMDDMFVESRSRKRTTAEPSWSRSLGASVSSASRLTSSSRSINLTDSERTIRASQSVSRPLNGLVEEEDEEVDGFDVDEVDVFEPSSRNGGGDVEMDSSDIDLSASNSDHSLDIDLDMEEDD